MGSPSSRSAALALVLFAACHGTPAPRIARIPLPAPIERAELAVQLAAAEPLPPAPTAPLATLAPLAPLATSTPAASASFQTGRRRLPSVTSRVAMISTKRAAATAPTSVGG